MSDIKFSVVIPLYNKEQSIVNTVLSVLKQSYQNFEIVIINDGSTDSSVDVVKNINDERIRLIHQGNQGVSAARNLGITEASYEWIAFLDGDDLWRANHLEEIIKMMNTFPNEKVYVTSFEYSDKRKMFKHKRNSSIFKIENYFLEAIKESLIWTSIVVVHKSCFEKVGYFNMQLNRGEDLDLWARLARVYRIVKSSKITAIYNIDIDKTSLTKIKSNKTILLFINLKKIDSVERIYFKKLIVNRMKSDFLAKDFRSLFKFFIKHNIELFK
ncbi:glycosyltransferase family 2 protein [Acinetobacter variabilis]|uniref:glycosyltransferase family 2 protein n=1 Tax=Acinetobacter variabilis TaxID=70346 RepID=UPI0028AA597F|nr:glycosyltransferase family 2 protein [Acinetobacter variabilis]